MTDEKNKNSTKKSGVNEPSMRVIIGAVFTADTVCMTEDSGYAYDISTLLIDVNDKLDMHSIPPIAEIILREELVLMISEGILLKILGDKYVITEKGLDWFNDPNSN